MKFQIGDFVLINFPCYGISDRCDLGPWIVEVSNLSVDGIEFIHYLRLKENCWSISKGNTLYSNIITKIHERDVEVLFKTRN